MRISASLLAQLIAHAQAEAPNECCGVLGSIDGHVTTFYPARNKEQSPMRFEIHPQDQFEIYGLTEERGEETTIFHSHPKTEGVPSQTDINLASRWPGSAWAICSLAGEQPVVRLFEIDGPAVKEVELVVE